jgi:MFS family permease
MRRNATLFVVISLLSGFGSTALTLAAGIWTLELTGSVGVAALTGVCIYAPTFAAPWLGALVDRLPRRPLLIGVDVVLGAVLLSLLAVRSAAGAWLIFVVLLIRGIGYVLLDAGETAILPAAVTPSMLGEVNGWRSSAQEGMKLVAPLAGAGLYAWHGPSPVVLLGAALPLITALCYSLVRLHPKPAPRVTTSPKPTDAPPVPADPARTASPVNSVPPGTAAASPVDTAVAPVGTAVSPVGSVSPCSAGASPVGSVPPGIAAAPPIGTVPDATHPDATAAPSPAGNLRAGRAAHSGDRWQRGHEDVKGGEGVGGVAADRGVRAGLAVLFQQRAVRAPVLVAGTAIAMSGLTNAALLARIVHGLHLPATHLGFLGSAQGAGSIVGGLLVGRLLARATPAGVAATGAALFAAGCGAWCLPWWPAMIVGSVLVGLGLPWTLIAGVTAVQTGTPDHLLGRVAATSNTVMFGPVALAIPLGAAFVQWGARPPLLTAAAVAMAAAALALRDQNGRRAAESERSAALALRG